MAEQSHSHDKQWSLIVARAWADEEFKSRLKADPGAVLREHGIETAAGVEVSVVEDPEVVDDTDDVVYYRLPANPAGDLSEEELGGTAVAYCYSGGCFRCYRCGCGCGGCGRCGGCAQS